MPKGNSRLVSISESILTLISLLSLLIRSVHGPRFMFTCSPTCFPIFLQKLMPVEFALWLPPPTLHTVSIHLTPPIFLLFIHTQRASCASLCCAQVSPCLFLHILPFWVILISLKCVGSTHGWCAAGVG